MFTDFKKNHIINTNFLCYIGLCNATSKHWRKAFSRDNENDLVVAEHESVQPFEILPPPPRPAPPTCRQARVLCI